MPDWNELFRIQENRWKDVYPPVVDLLENFIANNHCRILDLGCGAGRHLKYLVEKGHSAFGMDISTNGLTSAFQLSRQSGFIPFLTQADMISLPYADHTFDAVISIHVIFHNPRALIIRSISEINRVIKPGGYALLTFNSTYSGRCGKGIKIEEDTYSPDVGRDQGIPHHFSSLKDLSELLVDFKVKRIELVECIDHDYKSSHWNVIIQKEECDE